LKRGHIAANCDQPRALFVEADDEDGLIWDGNVLPDAEIGSAV
jgi:hypothetical protein